MPSMREFGGSARMENGNRRADNGAGEGRNRKRDVLAMRVRSLYDEQFIKLYAEVGKRQEEERKGKMMNKVILIGNICSDPEAYTTQSGIARSTFRVAVQRPHKREETDFLTVVAWRQTAEYCNRYLVKGNTVAVEGSVQTRSYDAQDGSKRWVTEIIADEVNGLTRAKDGQQEGKQAKKESEPRKQTNDGFVPVDDDDELPFE